MGEIAIRDEAESPYLPTSRLVTRAYEAKSAHQLALSLTKTDFVPASMKDVGNATAAIIMGDELGFTPLASLRSIYVVHGTPALYARAMVALILSQGHELWTVTSTPEKVEVHGRRKGSDHEEVSIWTTARAQKAGYTSNKKYQTNPEEMLFSKASAEIARKIGADVLLGIAYSVEELELEDGGEVVELSRKPKLKAVTREPKLAESVEEPDLDEEETSTPDFQSVTTGTGYQGGDVQWESSAPATREDLENVGANFGMGVGDVISEKQVGLIGSLMTKLGMTDRAVAIAYVSDVVGRPVDSRKALTKFEGSRVIDALQHDIEQAKLAQEAGEGES